MVSTRVGAEHGLTLLMDIQQSEQLCFFIKMEWNKGNALVTPDRTTTYNLATTKRIGLVVDGPVLRLAMEVVQLNLVLVIVA